METWLLPRDRTILFDPCLKVQVEAAEITARYPDFCPAEMYWAAGAEHQISICQVDRNTYNFHDKTLEIERYQIDPSDWNLVKLITNINFSSSYGRILYSRNNK